MRSNDMDGAEALGNIDIHLREHQKYLRLNLKFKQNDCFDEEEQISFLTQDYLKPIDSENKLNSHIVHIQKDDAIIGAVDKN